jgi:hypothetical protein
MPTRVLVNDGMMWPWWADGGRFLSLSWALVEEHAMVLLAVPTQMLGAEVLQWLMGACLVPVATPEWLTGRLDGLEMGGLQDDDTAKASL